MFGDLTLIVPLGLAAALSPMMLTEQTVLLSGSGGRRSANLFALGVALVTALFLGVLVLGGHAISLPKRPTLSASMDIVVGLFLVLVAVVIHLRQPTEKKKPAHKQMSPGAAFGFGLFSMTTNFTSLAILLPAAKAVAADATNIFVRVALIAVLVVLTTIPAWVPLAATRIAEKPAERVLDRLGDLMARHGRTAAIVAFAALGALLVVRGLWHLIR